MQTMLANNGLPTFKHVLRTKMIEAVATSMHDDEAVVYVDVLQRIVLVPKTSSDSDSEDDYQTLDLSE